MKTIKHVLHILMAIVVTFGMLTTSMLQTAANTERTIHYNVSASVVPFIYCNTQSSGQVLLKNGNVTMPSDTYSVTFYFVSSKVNIDRSASIVMNANQEVRKSWGSASDGYYTTLNVNVDTTSDVTLNLKSTYKRNFSIRARKIITGDTNKANELETSLQNRPATYQLYDDNQQVYLEGTINTGMDANTNFIHWSQPDGGTQYQGKDDTYIANLPNGTYTLMEMDAGGDLITDNKSSTSVWLNSSTMQERKGRKYYTFTVSDETVNTWMEACNQEGQANSLFYGFYTTAMSTTYNISYDGNGNTAGTMRNHTNMHTNDSFNLYENAYVKSGYTFTGWNTLANPTQDNPGIHYDDKAAFTVNNENTILYAQWRKNTIVQHDVYIQDKSKEDATLVLADTKQSDNSTLAYDENALYNIVNPYVTQGFAYTGYTIEIKEKDQTQWKLYDTTMEIKDGSTIRYMLTIDKDVNQTKALSYRVEYWLEGETTPRESLTISQLVWINEQTTTLPVKAITLPSYEGYTFSHYEPTQIPSVIENGSIIKVMYEKVQAPVTPEIPETPETPETPVVPETPVTPVVPETPVTPITPEVPYTPITPVQPIVEAPTTPVVQEVQAPVQPNVQPDNTVIEEQETPKENGTTETIDKKVTPKASGKSQGSWAFINLICTLVTILIAILVVVLKHKKEEEEKQDCKEEQPVTYQRRRWTKLASVIVAIAIVIVFILTENMTLPMILVDKWTFLMVAISVVQIALYATARHWKQKDEDNNKVAYN